MNEISKDKILLNSLIRCQARTRGLIARAKFISVRGARHRQAPLPEQIRPDLPHFESNLIVIIIIKKLIFSYRRKQNLIPYLMNILPWMMEYQ